MSLTLRNTKGSPLTYTEMDNNLTYLEGLGTTGNTLTNTLSNGNETGGNDIVVTNGDSIVSGVSGLTASIQIGDFNTTNPGDGILAIGRFTDMFSNVFEGFSYNNSSGNDYIYGFNSYDGAFEVAKFSESSGSNRIGFYCGSETFTEMRDGTNGYINLFSKNTYLNGEVSTRLGTYVSFSNNEELLIWDNTSNNRTSRNTDKRATFVGTRNSTINSGVVNSVVVGGSGITATASNTVYVPSLVANGAVITLSGLPTYADNAAAVAGGLAVNRVYKTATGELRIVV
jgi:hypothetical protein